MFGGGLSLAKAFKPSGLLDLLKVKMEFLSQFDLLPFMIILCLMGLILTALMSNLAMVNIFVPWERFWRWQQAIRRVVCHTRNYSGQLRFYVSDEYPSQCHSIQQWMGEGKAHVSGRNNSEHLVIRAFERDGWADA